MMWWWSHPRGKVERSDLVPERRQRRCLAFVPGQSQRSIGNHPNSEQESGRLARNTSLEACWVGEAVASQKLLFPPSQG